MKCVIPCAGQSSRMEFVPKPMIQVFGKPVICHIIDLWRDGVDEFIFIIRQQDIWMLQHFPENSAA